MYCSSQTHCHCKYSWMPLHRTNPGLVLASLIVSGVLCQLWCGAASWTHNWHSNTVSPISCPLSPSSPDTPPSPPCRPISRNLSIIKIIQNLVQFRDNPRCWVWGGRGSSRHLQLGSTESFKPASQCPEFDCGWVQSGVRCAGLTWRALTLSALLLVYLARTLGWGQTTMGVSIQRSVTRM